MLKKQKKNEKGITLIALVITIIVLLILVAVSIAMLLGPNGILTKARQSQAENNHGEVKEKLQLETQAYCADKIAGNYTSDLLSYLKEHNFIDETGKVNIDTLLDGKELSTGNGTGDTDIYKVEEKAISTGSIAKIASTEPVRIASTDDDKIETYSIKYYDLNGSSKEIGLLEDSTALNSTTENTGSEESSKDLITFTIDGTSYQCEKGTTWEQWISSSKNKIKCWCYHTYPNPSELTSSLFDVDSYKTYIYSSDTSPSEVDFHTDESVAEFEHGSVLCYLQSNMIKGWVACVDEIMGIDYRFFSNMFMAWE